MPLQFASVHKVAPFLAVGLAILIPLILGYDGRRVFQLALLALPGIALLMIPVSSKAWHRTLLCVVWCWSMMFIVDGLARAYIRWHYDATPTSSMVLSALANTGPRESREYLEMYAPSLGAWLLTLVALASILAIALRNSSPVGWRAIGLSNSELRRWRWGALPFAIVVAVAYAAPGWRKLHPVPYWAAWANQVAIAKAQLLDRKDAREDALAYAAKLAPTVMHDGPSTIVLVISDSINRDNLGLYGYARDTTPGLAKRDAVLGNDKLVIRNAWATQASTVAALREIFSFGRKDPASPLHILALARAAGYRTSWISNHDDFGIDEMHAALADEKHMLSRQPGRITSSLDEIVLPSVRAALAHPASRKLVVVHLLGGHPHYSYRYPDDQNPFLTTEDSTDAKLRESKRSPWVRHLREHYDSALLYHDRVLSELLDLTINVPDQKGYRAWFFLSDHGQEVGHEVNRAGHSASTAAGFRIPAIVWQSEPRHELGATVEARPFRADWTGWTLMTLLGVRWNGFDATRDVLDAQYQWRPPALEAPIRSFVEGPSPSIR